MDTKQNEILTFIVEKQRFAFNLEAVDRVIRAVAITKLTNCPKFIEGVIDYYGEIIVVINLRKRLGYPLEELKLSDRFIISKTATRKIALIVDEIEELIQPDSEDLFNSQDLDAGMKFIKVFRDDDGIVLIYDLESLMSIEEEIELEKFLVTNFPKVEKI
jgi:purine-binding chemotaxis protein CheW